MLFFRGPEAVTKWLRGKDGMAGLDVNEAFEVARDGFIRPYFESR